MGAGRPADASARGQDVPPLRPYLRRLSVSTDDAHLHPGFDIVPDVSALWLKERLKSNRYRKVTKLPSGRLHWPPYFLFTKPASCL